MRRGCAVLVFLGLCLSREGLAGTGALDSARALNNFATELLAVRPSRNEARQDYGFTNPRDGWVFLSSTAVAQGAGRVRIAIGSNAGNDAAIVRSGDADGSREAMRFLPSGPHRLQVRCEGAARIEALVVRAIPEMIYQELGYNEDVPWTVGYGPYDWGFLDRIQFLDNVNVILERAPVSANAPHLENWRRRGGRLLSRYSMYGLAGKYRSGARDAGPAVRAWSGARGLASAGYDGILLDEFSGKAFSESYPFFTEAIQRIAQDPKFRGKTIYPYASGMFETAESRAFLQAVLDGGYRWAESRYLREQPTEEAARDLIDSKLRQNMLRYEEAFPGCAASMILNLGFFSAPPQSLNIHPGADYKVYMDMQMHLLANDPAFAGLYGVMWYHSAYTDEEIMRWGVKLLRHYCIEGRRERLTNDPYVLPHLQNPDFDEGAASWTLGAAEEGSISVKHAPGYGFLQSRYARDKNVGDHFLVTRRSAGAPNRFSQRIAHLDPGRLYSLKMFVTDYGELAAGKSVKQTHGVSIGIQGAEVLSEKSFREIFPSGLCGNSHGPFDRKNNLYVTYCVVVFRAVQKTADLVVSDWASDPSAGSGQADPGGPIGQELAFNFLELQPYLED